MIHRINLTNGNIFCIDNIICQSYTFLDCNFQEDPKYEWEIIFSILIDILDYNAQMLNKIVQCHIHTLTYKRLRFCRQVNKIDLSCRLSTLYHMFLQNAYPQYLRLYIIALQLTAHSLTLIFICLSILRVNCSLINFIQFHVCRNI